MNEFLIALVSEERNQIIPADRDYFSELIGEWDFDWNDLIGKKTAKGEWLFSRVLDGTGIQDLFICPSREERKAKHEPEPEYGSTIRTYNPSTGNWDIYYCCYGESTRLEAIKEGDEIVSGTYKAINRDLEDGTTVKIDNMARKFSMGKPEENK